MPKVVNVTPTPVNQTFELTLTPEHIKAIETVLPYLLTTHEQTLEHFGDSPEKEHTESNVVFSILSSLLPAESFDRIIEEYAGRDERLLEALLCTRRGIDHAA